MDKAKFTPAPWNLCHHLKSLAHDKSCPCGFRGSIGGPDREHTICEMGSTVIPGEEGLEVPRYDRATEIANAHLIAAAPELYAELSALSDALKRKLSINPNSCGNSIETDRIDKLLAKARGES